MRSLLPAAAACLVLSSFIASFAMALTAAPLSGPASAALATPTPPATGPGSGSDDAAKHAKRTKCLQQAKAKKLVGAQKSAFIKDCVEAP